MATTPERTERERAIYLPEPHAGQQAVLAGMARQNWLCAGRRWRKTTLAMPLMVEQMLQTGQEYVWAAPTYEQVRFGWDEMRRACGDVFGFNSQLMEATAPNGAKCHFRSLQNYDKRRGGTAFGMVIDEASEITGEAFYTVLRPMLLGIENAWLLAMGTPKGRNWFFDEWMRAGERAGHARWQIPSFGCAIDAENGRLSRQPHALENPFLSMADMEELYEQLGERRFRQEILAEFLDDAGGVFRGVRACIRGATKTAPGHVTERYVMGVDLAKYNDYTVCVVVDLRERQVVAFDRFNKADWGLQKARISALAQHWNDAMVWMDATGLGDPIYDDLQRAGLHIHPYKFTSASKTALIDNAVLLVEQRKVFYPDLPILLAELTAFEYSRSPAGVMRMNAPEGQHDDCVIAFALACWSLAHSSSAMISSLALDELRAPVSNIGGVNIFRKQF